MPIVRVELVDLHAPLVRAWSEAFAGYEHVSVRHGDLFESDADALVSPANSFGIMDGGLDRAIRDVLGGLIEHAVQRRIVQEHHGELGVGAAIVVATSHARWPHLVVAPTMRVPEPVGTTVNAYLAFRAVLLVVAQHNAASPERPIHSLIVPGLCTGIGAMEPRRCAAQMRVAYDVARSPARIPSFDAIWRTHRALRSS